MCVWPLSLVKCVCVAFVAVAGRRYTYTVCTYFLCESRRVFRAECFSLLVFKHCIIIL